MKYMGSKARHAKEILSVVFSEANRIQAGMTNWVEPFVGGANMIDKVPVAFARIGNDINEELIALFREVQRGFVPPDEVSEEVYNDVRLNPNKYEPAFRAFVAIGCSYSGKWFGGYARGNANNGSPRNYCLESKKNLLAQNIKGIVFTSGDYRTMDIPPLSIIYCDPPYTGTTKYKNGFDHVAFWEWCEQKNSEGHLVFVSEYTAPEGWVCVWEKNVNNSLTKETGSKQGIERLFRKIRSV
jgi:DNA adenine methylase